MLKRILLLILVAICIITGGPVTAASHWHLSIEQISTSLSKQYSANPQYLTSDNLDQVLSLASIDDDPIKGDFPFLSNLDSTMMIFRLGRSNISFDWDYGVQHEKAAITDNLFFGFGAKMKFKWNENWGYGIKALLDYGNIDNKSINWLSTRAGYVMAQKIHGSWNSGLADIEVNYKDKGRVYSFGLSACSTRYKTTYYDFPGYPVTYEASSSPSAGQLYLYAGLLFPISKNFSLLSRIECPLEKASGIGYLVNIDYGF